MLRPVSFPSGRTGAFVLSVVLLGACSDASSDPASPDALSLSRGKSGKAVDSVAVVAPDSLRAHADTAALGAAVHFTARAWDLSLIHI